MLAGGSPGMNTRNNARQAGSGTKLSTLYRHHGRGEGNEEDVDGGS